MSPRRFLAALAIPCALLPGAPALAGQVMATELLGPLEPKPSVPEPRGPSFRMGEGDLRQIGPRRNGLVASIPVRSNVQLGIGRFSVPEIARPRTYMETDRQPTGVRGRERGIAAIGVSLRFR